ncbi:hypothetical protein QE152_g5732 [Popillia japonica]|uniref:RNA-directed DNA polymerase n=1 Tax=Popillia japonica TaxID=7064 RepID=A0AAW1MKU7_POPJA
MRPEKNETAYNFGIRCKNMLNLLLTKVKSSEGNINKREVKTEIHKGTVLQTYLRGIAQYGELGHRVRFRNPNDIETAMSYVLEEENFNYFIKQPSIPTINRPQTFMQPQGSFTSRTYPNFNRPIQPPMQSWQPRPNANPSFKFAKSPGQLEQRRLPIDIQKPIQVEPYHSISQPKSNNTKTSLNPRQIEQIQYKNVRDKLRLNHLNDEEKYLINKLCTEYKDICYSELLPLTFTNSVKHTLNLKDETPIYMKPYRKTPEQRTTLNLKDETPIYMKPYRKTPEQRTEIKEQVSNLLRQDIIEESNSPWSAPVSLVPKKMDASGKIKYRMVIDYRRLNDQTIDDKKIQLDKCEFLRKEVAYLGHIITKDGVKPNPDKINAIRKYPLPKTRTEIKSFLGLVGYYRKFIKDFAKLTKPLTKCLKKGVKIIIDDEYKKAFENCKNILMNKPVLEYPDFEKPFILTKNLIKIKNKLKTIVDEQITLTLDAMKTFNETINSIQDDQLALQAKLEQVELELNQSKYRSIQNEMQLYVYAIFNNLVFLTESVNNVLSTLVDALTFSKLQTYHPSIISPNELMREITDIGKQIDSKPIISPNELMREITDIGKQIDSKRIPIDLIAREMQYLNKLINIRIITITYILYQFLLIKPISHIQTQNPNIWQ